MTPFRFYVEQWPLTWGHQQGICHKRACMQQKARSKVMVPETVNAHFTMARMPSSADLIKLGYSKARMLSSGCTHDLISLQHLVLSQGCALPQNVPNGLAMFSPQVLSQPSKPTTSPLESLQPCSAAAWRVSFCWWSNNLQYAPLFSPTRATPEELSITTLVSLAALLHGRSSCNASSSRLCNTHDAD